MRRTMTLLLAPLLAAVVLAACSGGGGTTNQTTAAGPTTTAAGAAATNPNVKTAMNAKFGEILTDTSGKTLYTLTNNGKDVPCTGQCAAIWPPLAGTDYYRFVNDKAAGDANGDGIQNFGGVWHVVHPAGATTPATSAPTATTEAPTSAGGGYGY